MPTQKQPKRFETKSVCKECRSYGLNCTDSTKCKPVRTQLRSYNGIRHTSDGFDCALPITIDSHSACSFECLYCFSDNILGHKTAEEALAKSAVGQTSLKTIENIFADRDMQSKSHWHIKKALKYDNRTAQGYPCPVQMGGLCDPGDNIEQNQGWLLQMIDLAIKYRQPLRMSTKGGVFLLPEYLERMAKAPELFWVAFSTITDDDEILKKIDRYTATASQRIQSVKNLTAIGVKTSLRLRHIMLGITDRKYAYKSLIEKFADAGARAISYEVGFYPAAIPNVNKWKWETLAKISGYDLKKIYSGFGKKQTCTRPSYLWTENIMHSIKEHAVKHGMTVGVSDPVWKQLSDVGCCCGIRPDDPVFGNWERENATQALIHGRDTGERIYFKDIVPEWAKTILAIALINYGAGAKVAYARRHETWEDKLREVWNNINKERSVMNYFQGALQPDGFDENGDRVYIYKGLQREFLKSQWLVWSETTDCQ